MCTAAGGARGRRAARASAMPVESIGPKKRYAGRTETGSESGAELFAPLWRLAWAITVLPPKNTRQTGLRQWLEKMAKPGKHSLSLLRARRRNPPSTLPDVRGAVGPATTWRGFPDVPRVDGTASRADGSEAAWGDLKTPESVRGPAGPHRSPDAEACAAELPASGVEQEFAALPRCAQREAQFTSWPPRVGESGLRSASDEINAALRRREGRGR
jgi:hypothetical protein